MEKHPALTSFYGTLNSICQYEVVHESLSPNQLRIMGRVYPAGIAAWKRTMEALKVAECSAKWSIDLSQVFFISGTFKYAWRIILQTSSGTDLMEYLSEVQKIVLNSAASGVDGIEVPLHASPTRHMGRARPVKP